MAEIIEFGRRAQNLRSVKDSGLRQRKIEALKKIFQCTRCMMKCAKCGAQIESDWHDPQKFATPYPFCRNCHEEYEEYKERINGKGSAPRYYWHNEACMEVWGCWLEHQQWLDQYRQSKEFLQLLDEAEELMKQ